MRQEMHRALDQAIQKLNDAETKSAALRNLDPNNPMVDQNRENAHAAQQQLAEASKTLQDQAQQRRTHHLRMWQKKQPRSRTNRSSRRRKPMPRRNWRRTSPSSGSPLRSRHRSRSPRRAIDCSRCVTNPAGPRTARRLNVIFSRRRICRPRQRRALRASRAEIRAMRRSSRGDAEAAGSNSAQSRSSRRSRAAGRAASG